MQFEWEHGNLGDFIRLASGNTPSKGRSEFWGGDVPWISAKDMKRFWIEDSEDHLTELGAANAARIVPPTTTLMLVRGMTLHNDVPICRVRRPSAFNQDVKAVLPKNGLDPNFLPYLLTANKSKLLNAVDSAGHGTGRLNTESILGLPVSVPPLPIQKKLSDFASSIDDKIELNRRMNATLEAMARALFKAWFVDFEPVHANKENRPSTSASPVIAKLFPSDFENGIPKGWALEPLGNHVEVSRGLSYKGAGLTTAEFGVPMHNLNSIFEGGGYKYEGIKYYSGAYKERHIVRPGDVIVANTEQGHKHLLIGFPAIVPQHFGEETIFSHHIYRVRSNATGRLSTSFIYYSLVTPSVREVVVGCSSGTTVNMLKMDGLQIPKVAVPPCEVLREFSHFIDNIWKRQENNWRENKNLAHIRDALLPRLILGKLRVGKAERTIEMEAL